MIAMGNHPGVILRGDGTSLAVYIGNKPVEPGIDLADFPLQEASGSIVVCEPLTGYKPRVVSAISAVQAGSGDPSPDNIRPITGWDAGCVTRTGANLLDPAWQPAGSEFYGLTVTKADGRITFDGTWTQTGAVDYTLMPSNYIPAGSYHLSGCPAGGTTDTYRHFVQIISEDGTRTYKNDTGSGVSFEVPEGGRVIIYIRFGASLGTVSGLTFAPMLVFGTAALPYEPHQATTLTAQMPETVYGGTLDWGTGVLTVTHGNIAAYAGETVEDGWISSTGELSDGAQVVYPLATPYTIQLDPQQLAMLAGSNTLWSDTGDTTVTYRSRTVSNDT